MPIVQINLVEGRTPEQLARMIEGVSRAIADALDAPLGTVRVMVNELRPHQYGVGGDPWPVVLANRGAADAPSHDQPSHDRPSHDPPPD